MTLFKQLQAENALPESLWFLRFHFQFLRHILTYKAERMRIVYDLNKLHGLVTLESKKASLLFCV